MGHGRLIIALLNDDPSFRVDICAGNDQPLQSSAAKVRPRRYYRAA